MAWLSAWKWFSLNVVVLHGERVLWSLWRIYSSRSAQIRQTLKKISQRQWQSQNSQFGIQFISRINYISIVSHHKSDSACKLFLAFAHFLYVLLLLLLPPFLSLFLILTCSLSHIHLISLRQLYDCVTMNAYQKTLLEQPMRFILWYSLCVIIINARTQSLFWMGKFSLSRWITAQK